MNPTPLELWIAFADAIQSTVGHQRSIQPQQEPLTDHEMYLLKAKLDEVLLGIIPIRGMKHGK